MPCRRILFFILRANSVPISVWFAAYELSLMNIGSSGFFVAQGKVL